MEIFFFYLVKQVLCGYLVSTMNKKVAYVIALVTTIICGLGVIPLAWMIPMTNKIKKAKEGHAVLTFSFEMCVLIFLNPVAGVFLLTDHEQ